MTHSQLIYRKSIFSKWLPTATLFLSFFAFSVYATEYQSRQSLAAKTELVLSTHPNFKRIVNYRLLLNVNDQGVAHDFEVADLDNAVLHHARFIKTTLDRLAKHFPSFKPVARFHPVKTIPQSTDEDSFNSLPG